MPYISTICDKYGILLSRKKTMKYTFFLIAIVSLLPTALYSSMTGGDYELYADSFSFVDGGIASGGTFELFGSSEGFQTAVSTNGTYELRGGYQAQEKGILSFELSDNSINLGQLSTGNVATATLGLSLQTDSFTGFSLSLSEDGNLRSGANDIDDVGDGAVSAGSEEYGVATQGQYSLFADDRAIAGSLPIASHNGLVDIVNQEDIVIFKAAISSSTASGTYSHVVTFSATVNP